MQIGQILVSQGFGTRRECAQLIAAARVTVAGRSVTDAAEEFDTEGLVLHVDGQPWPVHERAVVLLHKPAGYECSRRPGHHPSVFALLPPPLRQRGVQPVGRLDADTTGVLLFTDDGALLHRLTSPRHHVVKVYEVTLRHPVSDAHIDALVAGVPLRDAPQPVRAVACERTGTHTLRLTLTEGRYHQVKRMVAAAGNRVEALHRSSFADLTLPVDQLPGHWRWVEPRALQGRPG